MIEYWVYIESINNQSFDDEVASFSNGLLTKEIYSLKKKIFIEASAHVVNVNICVANEFSL